LRETIQALQAIGAAWNRAHPAGPKIGVGEISQRGGGKISGHASHQLGVDVDLRLLRNDGQNQPVTRFESKFSLALTQELINLIHGNGVLRVRYIFFNDPRATGVSCWPNHDNHLHVKFCAPGDSACHRQIPRNATTQRCTPERLRELTEGKSGEFEAAFEEAEWTTETFDC
jgi:murein endopeptidase